MPFNTMPFCLLIVLSLSTVASAQQATQADVQALEQKVSRIETTVNAMDKRLTGLEITVSEMDKRITTQFQAMTIQIGELDKRLTARIDVLFWAIGSLIGIVLAVIVLPQVLGYFQEKRGREELQKQIQALNQRVERQQWEIEELKSRRIVTPS